MLLNAMTVGEKFSSGGITILLGLGGTFIIIGVMMLFMLLLQKGIDKVERVPVKNKGAALTELTDAGQAGLSEEPVDARSCETVTAAVDSYMRTHDTKPHTRYTIKSIKKVDKEAGL